TAVLRATGAALSPAAEASRVAFDFVETTAAVTAAAASSGGGAIGLFAKSSSGGSGSGSGLGRIFIAEPPAHLPVSWLLASAVSRVLGSPVVLPIQPLFTIPAGELQQLQPVLLPGGFDAGLETAAQAGVPGAPLLPADSALLQLKPLRHYCAGEVVAYQRTTAVVAVPTAAAAAAAERRLQFGATAPGPNTAAQEVQVGAAAAATAGGGGSSSSSSSGSNLCYGRVAAHCVPAAKAAGASGGVHRVLVEVEPGVVQHLLSTQVFCFRSATGEAAPPSTATAAASSSSTAADFSAAASSSSAATAAAATDDASLSAGVVAGAGVAGSSSSRSATPLAAVDAAAAAVAAQPSSGGVLNPVSSSEMLAAVRDVMAAAGLPLDPAAGQLMGRVAMLQEKLTEAQEQLEQAKREAASSAAEAENARGAWQCKICFGRDVDSAYTTCGHTICARCANAAGSNRCPVCRKTSQALLRLYRA
ncbi:hypothetical protein Vafri_11038, partial [Volvox africanus]